MDEKIMVVPSEPFEWRAMEHTLTVKREKDGERTEIEFNGFATKETLDALIELLRRVVE